MSFQFPKPVLDESTNTSSDFDYKYHYPLMWKRGPDYDELIIPLSLFAFNRLSASEQWEQVEEIRRIVKSEDMEEQRPEESDKAFRLRSFSELFKKLSFSAQLAIFLSKVLQKFKRERQLGELMSSFKKLDAEEQQQAIEKIVHAELENLRKPGETEEDFRLRRFTQLSKDYTHHVYKLLIVARKDTESKDKEEETSNHENNSDWKCCFSQFFLGFSVIWFQGQGASGQDLLLEQRKDTPESEDNEDTSNNENNSDWKSSFSEFFLGFSIIWFKGQDTSGQDLLLEQLSLGIGGSVVIQNRLPDESEEDFKLRRFREVCKKVVDFGVQMKFLDNAQLKLEHWANDHFSFRCVLEPQEYDRAAELLSDISTLGFGLLSAKYKQQKIDEMSNQVEGRMIIGLLEERHDLSEEAIRMKRFRELFNQVPVHTRIDLFKEMRSVLLKLKSYSEAIHFFSGLRSEDQTEMIEKLMHKIRDSAQLIIEKLSGESEEDFLLRRFTKVCVKHLSTWNCICWPETDMERVRQGTSDNEEESLYAKFLFDVSVTWFKARCPNYRRNPLHVILFGEVEFRDVIERPPEESEEDFRLRRFTESFKRLEYSCKVTVVDYIQDTLFGDLGHPVSYLVPCSVTLSDGRSEFDIEWLPVKLSKLQGQTPAATTQGASAAAGTGATTQAGGGSGVGTSQ